MSALPLPPSVLHGEVTGSLHSAEQVDSPDSDVDSIPLVGEVIFTPSPKTLRSKAAKRIFTPAPIAVPLDETGSFHVRLLATDDPSLEPTGWTYSVRFNLRAGATIDGYSISVPAGTVNDLADIAPVKPDNGVFYLRGPKGDTGEPGPKGDKGDPGEPGPKGDPGELVVHAATHATGGSDPITPASIGAIADDDPRLRDTGWRVIPTDTTAHPLAGGTVQVRRVGYVVTLKIANVQLAATTESPVQFIPASGAAAVNATGFLPSTGRLPFFASRTNSIVDRHSMVAWTSGSNLALIWYHRESIDTASTTRGLTLPASTSLTGEISWFTDNPWPTTLPGTPA